MLSTGCLTCCARFLRESEFGFKDRKTPNVNIKVTLNKDFCGKIIQVHVNGKVEKEIRYYFVEYE